MQTTYTEGPWTYKDDFELVIVPKNNPEAEAICEITGNPSEQFANARLIAAAPTMLNALIEAEKLINSIRQYMPKSIQNADRFNFENINANVIKAAIQKATQP
jgi:hypothetical protein